MQASFCVIDDTVRGYTSTIILLIEGAGGFSELPAPLYVSVEAPATRHAAA